MTAIVVLLSPSPANISCWTKVAKLKKVKKFHEFNCMAFMYFQCSVNTRHEQHREHDSTTREYVVDSLWIYDVMLNINFSTKTIVTISLIINEFTVKPSKLKCAFVLSTLGIVVITPIWFMFQTEIWSNLLWVLIDFVKEKLFNNGINLPVCAGS